MNITTPWGYEILNASSLPEIITVQEFNEMTINKYSGDQRVQNIINAVSSTIRNYVGWHLADCVECSVTYTFDDLHVTKVGSDLVILLPSRASMSITKLLINDHEVSPKYFLKINGILKIYGFGQCCQRYDTITIQFMSGLTNDYGLKSVVCSRVSNALAGNIGVSSETAGGVSISYNSQYVNGINPNALLTVDREYLMNYKIEELL